MPVKEGEFGGGFLHGFAAEALVTAKNISSLPTLQMQGLLHFAMINVA